MAESPSESPENGGVAPGQTLASVTDQITAIPLTRRIRGVWLAAFAGCFLLVMMLLYMITWFFWSGPGLWGPNIPAAWGFPIVNYVWWIGIGNAGTFISAALLLLHQEWRASINRMTEAMTIFAAAIAASYPILHLGRPWLAYWIIPYPDTMGVWPQWLSPLVWDFFAIAVYLLVSILFWYMGLLPDLASLRDRALRPWVKKAYGLLALGWRGSARHWRHYQTAYILLAGLATPLVVSVHSVVSLDFAAGNTPGYHSTIFPPYFVAGALYSGFAMVLTIVIPVRAAFGLENLITARHLDRAAKVMLAAGLLIAYSYVMEIFTAWYGADPYERYIVLDRFTGYYAGRFAVVMFCNVVVVQALWFRFVRARPVLLFVVAILVNVGMWLERFVIVVQSLHRDYLPSSWFVAEGTGPDLATLMGMFGLFAMLLFLFLRFLPVIAAHEVKSRLPESGELRP